MKYSNFSACMGFYFLVLSSFSAQPPVETNSSLAMIFFATLFFLALLETFELNYFIFIGF